MPGVADLASLALRRAFERLESGGTVSLHDVAGLLRLQREIEREAAGQDADNAARWEATLREVLWAARSHLGEHWEPFVADIRANQHLAAMWGPPRRSGTGPGRFPRPRQSITLDCPSRQKPITPASSDLEELLRGCGGQAESQVSRANYFCCSN